MLFGLQSLRDLDRLEEAGLLGKAPLPHELRSALGLVDDAPEETPDDSGFESAGFWERPRKDDNKEIRRRHISGTHRRINPARNMRRFY
jgi:hypothetical protein